MKFKIDHLCIKLWCYVFICFGVLSGCDDKSPKLESELISITFSKTRGGITSLAANDVEYISSDTVDNSLFALRFRDEKGTPIEVKASMAEEFLFSSSTQSSGQQIKMQFNSINGLDCNAEVIATLGIKGVTFEMSFDNQTDYIIDHIDFPILPLANGLGPDENTSVFTTYMEGAVTEGKNLKGKYYSKPVEFPMSGWGSHSFPGLQSNQYMAWFKGKSGLYMGAHDPQYTTKAMDVYARGNDKFQMNVRVFPGGLGKGKFDLGYPTVIAPIKGDWHAAADVYRSWFDETKKNGKKLFENPMKPQWMDESPIVITYPVRGIKDTGDMSPNEYFPYTNALPYIDSLASKLDSKLLVLLMHWEGTAPWAPPYVWPPYGGEKMLAEFRDALHARGHTLGLYASGTGYTVRSNTDTTYNQREEFETKNIKRIVTVAPDGQMATNGICVGPKAQREGFDMCPANPFVKEVVLDQIKKMTDFGIDYIQYFDQNTGGACYFCYSKDHGHPPAPGAWQTETMQSIFKEATQYVNDRGSKTIIGCEHGAAEPFVDKLLFNDLRFNIAYTKGLPVPAYAYMFHEYLHNFMGNQVHTKSRIDHALSPQHLQLRTAYAFTSGDALTGVLAGKGKLNWGWCDDWNAPGLDQEAELTLMKNLNAMRKGIAKPFLLYGRMLSPDPIIEVNQTTLHLKILNPVSQPSVLTSKWQDTSGNQAQVFANYTTEDQVVKVQSVLKKKQKFTLFKGIGRAETIESDAEGLYTVKVPALNAALIVYEK